MKITLINIPSPIMSSNATHPSKSSVTQVSTIEKPVIHAAKTTSEKAMPEKTEDFVKNLFQAIQGVKYDDRCPHGLPYYACMSCSH